jgi:protein-disulfide isomerase
MLRRMLTVVGLAFWTGAFGDGAEPRRLGANQAAVNTLIGRAGLLTTLRPQLGKSAAPVQVSVFEDFTCSRCKHFHLTVFPILQRYIQRGEIHYTFMNLPFHGPGSVNAALAAMCIFRQNPALFWAYRNKLYRYQPRIDVEWPSSKDLHTIAQVTPGVDMLPFERCMRERTEIPAIRNDASLLTRYFADSIATPMIFVNGQRFTAATYDELFALINRLLAAHAGRP